MRGRGTRRGGAGLLLLLGLLGCGGGGAEDDREQLQYAQQLRFVVQPPDGRAGEALEPVVTVEVLDMYGERVRGLETTVELRLPALTSATNLVGGMALTYDGRATFPALTVMHVGAYELEARSGTGMSARSRTFTIHPAGGGAAP